MIRQMIFIQGRTKTFNCIPERPMKKAEVRLEEFEEDGTRYYRNEEGKIWDADIYDKNFKPAKSTIKPKVVYNAPINNTHSAKVKRAWKTKARKID